jgi:hypothetical protein
MKKLICLLVLFVSGTVTSLHAEMVWKTGYVILSSGDSIKGDIKVNTKKELSLFQKVYVKQGESSKTYKPEQVKEYGYESSRFISRKVDGEMQFMKVLSYGRIILYEWQFELQRGAEVIVEKEYYIETNDGSGKIEKTKPGKFKKAVAELMADNPELVARVQNEDKKYEIGDVQNIVAEYNTWYEQEGNSLKGSG